MLIHLLLSFHVDYLIANLQTKTAQPPVPKTREQQYSYRLRLLIVGRCIPHPPAAVFHPRYLDSWDTVDAKNIGVGNASPKAFRRRIVRYGTLLVCGAIDPGESPEGGVIHTVL